MAAVRGRVTRASSAIPDIQRTKYRCTKCQAMKDVEIKHGRIDESRKCRSFNTRGSSSLLHLRSSFSDKQTIRLQEASKAIPKEETSATSTLVVYDTLVDAVKPGDRAEVTGILRATHIRINDKQRTIRSVYRTCIDCIHISTLKNNQSRGITEGQRNLFGGKNALGQPVQSRASAAMNLERYTEGRLAARKEFYELLCCHRAL